MHREFFFTGLASEMSKKNFYITFRTILKVTRNVLLPTKRIENVLDIVCCVY